MTPHVDDSRDSSTRRKRLETELDAADDDSLALESIVARFERAWQSDKEPKLVEFLPEAPTLRRRVLVELAFVDLEFRLKRGQTASVEDYLAAHDELQVDREATVELILAESALRRRLGHPAELAEYQRRFPDLRNELAARWPRQPDADGELPRRLGRFELIEVAGHGAFGTVYRAYDTELRRTVAVKIPRLGALAQGEDVERFLREAQNAARLSHPAIVPVYEVGQCGGVCYFVSEFVAGQTLAERIASDPPGIREAATLVAELAAALEAAHRAGVIHRDVKPANILLDRSGRARIMDFGLAKFTAGDANLTVEGQLLGTPAYMSPEQAGGGARRVDGRTDVYSLGAVLYHLLTGVPPFTGTQQEVLLRVAQDEPRPPRQWNPQIPRDLQTICLRAMARDPSRRYPCASALADDLRRFLSSEPIHARPASAFERTRKWMRRRPAMASLVAVCLVAVGLFTAGLVWHQWEQAHLLRLARNAQIAAEEREQKVRQFLRAADLRLAYLAWTNADVAQADEILARHTSPSGNAADADFAWRLLRRMCHNEDAVLRGHSDDVYSVAYSSDGKALASAGRDGTVRLWDLDSNESTAVLRGHTGEVNAVTFLSDGLRLASASDDGSVKIWHVATGGLLRELTGHGAYVLALASSPQGSTIASGDRDGVIRLWDADDGRLLASLEEHRGAVQALAFSDDGARLASSSSDGTAIVWDVARRSVVHTLNPEAGVLTTVAFAPRGQRLATGSEHYLVHLWDADSGKLLESLEGHREIVQSLAFVGNEANLVSCDKNGLLRIWQCGPDGEFLSWPLYGHAGRAWGLAVAPDGAQVASGGADGQVRLWTPARLVLATSDANARLQETYDLAFSRDSSKLVVAFTDAPLTRFDVGRTGFRPLPSQAIVDGGARCLSMTTDGTRMAVGDLTGMATIFDTSGGEIASWLAHETPLVGVAIAPRGDRVVTLGDDYTVRAWSLDNQAMTWEMKNGFEKPLAVAIDGAGAAVVVGYGNGELRCCDLTSGQRRWSIHLHRGGIQDLAILPDGARLISGSDDRTARIWDLASGKPLAVLHGHASSVTSLDVSPDASTVVVGTARGVLRFWDLATYQELFSLPVDTRRLSCVQISPDGALLAVGSANRSGAGQLQILSAAP